MNPERFELAVKTSKGEIKKFPLANGSYTIGRSPSCEVYIPESSISRKHACILVSNGHATIEDLDSLNGTLVGEKRVEGTMELQLGDLITLGELEAKLLHLNSGEELFGDDVWLEILNTSNKGKTVRITTPRMVVGRSASAPFQINHPTISRAHAVFRYAPQEGGWMLEDRNSANGTYVNGVMITQALIYGGEKLRFGDVEVSFLGDQRPVPRKRYGLLIVLIALLGVSIALLLVSLIGSVAN